MITIYGLRTCETCRRARAWLEERGRRHMFVDLRLDGVDAAAIGRWTRAAGWEALLNRRSTTWRQLDGIQKEGMDETRAIALMTENPTLIKRPVFEVDGTVLVGFNQQVQERLG